MVPVSRAVVSLVLVATVSAGALAQTPPPPQSPQLQAMNAAMRNTDPKQKLEALEKVRADYPSYTLVDQQILLTRIASFADETKEMKDVYIRIISRIPETVSPDSRLSGLLGPTTALLPKKLLLDYVEPLIETAVAKLDYEAYAKSRRDVATRLNQPVLSDSIMQSQFNGVRGRGLETLGRIYLGRGDSAKAERAFTDAVIAAPAQAYAVAATTLVEIYTARKDYAKAEQFLKETITRMQSTPVALSMIGGPVPAASTPATAVQSGTTAAVTPPAGAADTTRPAGTAPTPSPATSGRGGLPTITTLLRMPPPTAANPARVALGELYLTMNEPYKADSVLRSVINTAPTYRPALLALARLASKQGNNPLALEHYSTAALAGALAPADATAMRDAFRTVKGSDAGLDAHLDHLYEEKFPNPVKPLPWDPAKKTDRVLLLEMFTGSGCGPCVASDLALDAALLRYPADVIAPIAYHANIPAPDPMVVTSVNEGRRIYYHTNSVPRILIDGAVNRGGGGRTGTQAKYDSYVKMIDSLLAIPSGAVIEVSASGKGDKIEVTTDVKKLPADARDVRLHVVLVEKMLRFSGENGIRFHPMVARAVSSDGKGDPISKTGKTKHTFSLSDISKNVAATLDAELTRRRSASTTVRYAAEGNAFTAIDTTQLMVVAFLQSGKYTAVAATGAANAAGDGVTDDTPATTIDPALGAAARSKANIVQAVRAPVVFRR
jgi:tetratricopeptide (TPR) repeat protein